MRVRRHRSGRAAVLECNLARYEQRRERGIMHVIAVPLITTQHVRAGGVLLDAAECCVGRKIVASRHVVGAGARKPETPAKDISNGIADNGVRTVEAHRWHRCHNRKAGCRSLSLQKSSHVVADDRIEAAVVHLDTSPCPCCDTAYPAGVQDRGVADLV